MTFDEARDEILGVFLAVWKPLGYPVVWTDVPADVPSTATVWARVTVRHATGRQASLAGEDGARRWNRTGTLYVQVFAPVGDGSASAYAAAQVVANAYQAARGLGVWFRNTRINEVGASGAFEQINVLTDFSYDDVR